MSTDAEELEAERAEWLARSHSVAELTSEIRGLWKSIDSWINLLRAAKGESDQARADLARALEALGELHKDAVHSSSLLWQHLPKLAIIEENGSGVREHARHLLAELSSGIETPEPQR